MKRFCVAAVLLCLPLWLASCGSPSPSQPTLDYGELVTPALDKDITQCVTEQQLSAAVGRDMTLTGVYEDGTQAVYTDATGRYTVMVNMKNMTREAFDALADGLEDAEPVEELGERACWVGGQELLCYAAGYGIDVAIETTASRSPLPQARAVVQALLEAVE